MTNKLDQGTTIYAAGVILKHLQALQAEVDGVLHSKDIEYIHRMRVATRRLRSAMQIFKPYLPGKRAGKWTREVRTITQALGEARDTDVQLDLLAKYQAAMEDPHLKTGINRLGLRLRQKRQGLQETVVRTLSEFEAEGVAAQMQERLAPVAAQAEQVYIYTPTLYEHAHNTIRDRLGEFMAYEVYISQPERVTELHTMRIYAKHLRYTMEAFTPLYSSGLKTPLQVVRSVQENLGDIHDSDVWIAFLPQFLEEERLLVAAYFGQIGPYHRLRPGIEAFLANRQQFRSQVYAGFVEDWEKWKTLGVWDELRTTIQVPFLRLDQVYPPAPPLRPEIIPPSSGEAVS